MPAFIEGRFEFPQSIFFLGECLGLESNFLIDGQRGILGLPAVTLDGDKESRPELMAPPMAQRSVLDAIPDLSWGYVNNGADGHFAASMCYLRVVVDAAEDEVEERAKRIAYLVPWWFDRVKDWVEVMTGQDLYEYERPYTERDNRPYGSFYLFRDGAGTDVTPERGIWMSPWPIEKSITKPKWVAALAAASEQKRPRAEHLIMRDANAALVREHHRKAVVDAGSAVELAITRRIRERLAGKNEEPVIESLLRAHANLGRRVTLARKLGVALPAKLERDLVIPRNNAVHKGETPDPLSAMVAVHVAGEIVGKREA